MGAFLDNFCFCRLCPSRWCYSEVFGMYCLFNKTFFVFVCRLHFFSCFVSPVVKIFSWGLALDHTPPFEVHPEGLKKAFSAHRRGLHPISCTTSKSCCQQWTRIFLNIRKNDSVGPNLVNKRCMAKQKYCESCIIFQHIHSFYFCMSYFVSFWYNTDLPPLSLDSAATFGHCLGHSNSPTIVDFYIHCPAIWQL